MSDKIESIADVASEGGKARAAALTPEERSKIAKKGADARWNSKLPKATHEGTLKILSIPCSVLDNGMRLLSEREFTRALGGKRGGSHWKRQRELGDDGAKLPVFLSAKNLTPFIPKELAVALNSPIQYVPLQGGRAANGILATLVPDICQVFLKARAAEELHASQKQMAQQAEIMLVGLAHVGIIALVDEATGYQYARLKDDLARILEQYVSKEVARYSRVLEEEFYKHICRLKGWAYDPTTSKRTHALARLTLDLLYDRIHPDFAKELKRVRSEKGRKSHQLHRWATIEPNGGHPRIKQQAEGVTAFLCVARSWTELMDWMNLRYPKHNETKKLLFEERERDEPTSSI